MTSIELRVLGDRELLGPDGRPAGALLAQPKRFALFAFLVLDRPFRAHSRDELLGMFWPEQPESNARNALAQALSFIRRALGPGVVLNAGPQGIVVDKERISCDAVDFAHAMANDQELQALGHYRGDLLPGFHVADATAFDEWLEAERRFLRARAAQGARILADRAEAAHNTADAVAWATRQAALEPYDEAATLRLMMLHQDAGDRARALLAYGALAARLATDLELEPSADLQRLAAQVRATTLPSHPAEPDPASWPSESTRHAAPAAQGEVATGAARPSARSGHARRARWFVGAASVLALSGYGLRSLQPPARPIAPVRGSHVNLVLADSQAIRTDIGGVLIALDPAGRRVVYVGGARPERLYVRSLDDPVPRAITGTEHAKLPQFSHDGQGVTFIAAGALKEVSLATGVVTQLADSVNRYSLGDDGSVLFERPMGTRAAHVLYRLGGRSGRIAQVTSLRADLGERAHTWPALLPGSGSALFEIDRGVPDSAELGVVNLANGAVTRLGVRGHNPRYIRGNVVVFARGDGTLHGVRLDAAQLRVIGAPFPLLGDVQVSDGGAMQLAVSEEGTLVYLPKVSSRRLVLFDPLRHSSRVIGGSQAFSAPRLSPDGQRVAVAVSNGSARDVWIVDVQTGALSRMTSDGHSNSPEWTPDGRRIMWQNDGDTDPAIWWQRADARDTAERLLTGTVRAAWGPSMRFLVSEASWRVGANAFGRSQVRMIRREPDGRVVPPTLLGMGSRPRVSPDGQWVAYVSAGPGVPEVLLRNLAMPREVHRVSDGGGHAPVWGATSHELYYDSGEGIVRARLDLAPTIRVVSRTKIDGGRFWSSFASSPDYDVSRDGRQMIVVEAFGMRDHLTVVFDWAELVQARLSQIAAR